MTPQQQSDRLAELLDRHGAALALFAAQWCDAADDCVQEALIQLAGQRSWPDNPPAWLFRVVKNRAISQGRSRERRRRHEELAARFRPEPTKSEDFALEAAQALEALESDEREVVIARVWGKLTLEQTAQALGVSVSTAHRRYEAAIEKLRRTFAQETSR